jgi:hypothetical protein
MYKFYNIFENVLKKKKKKKCKNKASLKIIRQDRFVRFADADWAPEITLRSVVF